MLANGPPSFGSDGLKSIFSNFPSNHTLVEVIHNNGSGMHFRVAGGDVLSGIGIRAAVEQAGSSGDLITHWEL